MTTLSMILAGFILLPGALRAQAPGQFRISVVDGGIPVLTAKVTLILKSGAYQNATLAGDVYTCNVPGPCVKVFAAAPGHEAAVLNIGNNGAGTITVNLKLSATKNSVIIESAGTLPGIEGRVNPILDEVKGLYLYTTKIGLREGGRTALQPMKFTENHAIDAETVTGSRFKIWVVDITRRVSLLEYTMPE